MGGIEEIIRQIEEDSNNESDKIIKAAKADCDKLKSECDKEIREYIVKDNEDIEKLAKIELAKLKSSADSLEKQKILKIKQDIISEMIEKAHKSIRELPSDKYFDVLLKIAKNNAHEDEEGLLCLGKDDLERIPVDFEKRLSESGLRLRLSDKAIDIKDGLVLSYGDIYENCTISSLIDAKKERLFDLVNSTVFRRQ